MNGVSGVRTHGAIECRNGKPVRLYGAFQDITERKQAEGKILAYTRSQAQKHFDPKVVELFFHAMSKKTPDTYNASASFCHSHTNGNPGKNAWIPTFVGMT